MEGTLVIRCNEHTERGIVSDLIDRCPSPGKVEAALIATRSVNVMDDICWHK